MLPNKTIFERFQFKLFFFNCAAVLKKFPLITLPLVNYIVFLKISTAKYVMEKLFFYVKHTF